MEISFKQVGENRWIMKVSDRGPKIEFQILEIKETFFYSSKDGGTYALERILSHHPGFRATTVAELGFFWFFNSKELKKSKGDGVHLFTTESKRKRVRVHILTLDEEEKGFYPTFGAFARGGFEYYPFEIMDSNFFLLVARD